jgi:hypothetical protein
MTAISAQINADRKKGPGFGKNDLNIVLPFCCSGCCCAQHIATRKSDLNPPAAQAKRSDPWVYY